MSAPDRAARGDAKGAAGYDAAAYGEVFADVYDQWYHDVTDAEATADFVASRCSPPVVVELGVGTGRLARPLAARGLTVVGVDASAAMLDRCRQHPRSDRASAPLHLVRADMAALPVRGPVGGMLVAFNTLFNLPTAATQAAVFHQAARLLDPGGCLIVETLDPAAFDQAPGASVGVRQGGPGEVTVVATTVDPEAQTITGRHVAITDAGVDIRPWHLRWASPDQLDGYATRAGLTLAERHPHWRETDPPPDHNVHISVYRPHP